MRFVFAALMALALGLLPAGTARARERLVEPAAATMSCHDRMDAPMHHDSGDETPDHDMQACASHCLSQVNAPALFTRLLRPALHNSIASDLSAAETAAKPRLKEAPDPPPPRS
jgi:hypothetical protein